MGSSKLIQSLLEIDAGDQKSLLQDHIEETTIYYIICDECRGTTDDLTMSTLGFHLYDKGWRLREDERGREYVFCPRCVEGAES